MSPNFKQVWYVSFDKLPAYEEVYVYRERCGTYDEAVAFENYMQERGYRTKKWWTVEDNPIGVKLPPDHKPPKARRTKWHETVPGMLLISLGAFVLVGATFFGLAYWVASKVCHVC